MVEQQAECVELEQKHAGVAVIGEDEDMPDVDTVACVEVQVLLARPANSKLQLQGPGLSNEQMAC
jgi:hypothetical protein